MIRDKAKLPVGVNQCVGCLGHGHQRQRVVGSLDIILDDARQKLELLGQVGILGCVNLGELQFEGGKFFVDSFEDFRCDLLRTVMEELRYL